MLYNMKNENLKYNTNNLLDKWWKPLEMVAGNWRKLQTASLDWTQRRPGPDRHPPRAGGPDRRRSAARKGGGAGAACCFLPPDRVRVRRARMYGGGGGDGEENEGGLRRFLRERGGWVGEGKKVGDAAEPTHR
jgi:hypothetical protein